MSREKSTLKYLISSIALFFIIFVIYKDYGGIYGDSILQLAYGREFALPIWGQWIPERVFADFFANLLFQIYYIFIAQLFGVNHFVDAYTLFMASVYALNVSLLSLACFKYSKLFVEINASYYFLYGLVFYILFLANIDYTNITLIFAYDLGITIGVWFAYPFLAYATTDKNVFERIGQANSVLAVAISGYFVIFSITNVTVFVSFLLFFAGIYVICKNAKTIDKTILKSLYRSFKRLPLWFRFGLIYIPIITLVSVVYAINGRRFSVEKDKGWGDENFEISISDAIGYLDLGYDSPMSYLLTISFLLVGINVALNFFKKRVDKKRLKNNLISVGILFATLVCYFMFVLLLSKFSSRNYFTYGGFPVFFGFFSCLFIATILFSFNNDIALKVMLVPIVFVISLHSVKQIINPKVSHIVSPIESKYIFNSMYMSYCYSSDKVPVFADRPAYPVVPIPEKHTKNWFGIAFSSVFSKYVVHDNSVKYFPTFYAVESVDEFHDEISKITKNKNTKCLDVNDSPYYIEVSK